MTIHLLLSFLGCRAQTGPSIRQADRLETGLTGCAHLLLTPSKILWALLYGQGSLLRSFDSIPDEAQEGSKS